MFGCLVAVSQTNLQQIDETHVVFSLESASTINHLAVFMLGTIPFPQGFAATVHFHWPSRGFQLLGMLSNEKPSAIFRVRGAYGPQHTRAQATFTRAVSKTEPGGDDDVIALLGISIEPIDVVQNQISNLPSSSVVSRTLGTDPSLLAERIIKHLFNYLLSFSATGNVAPSAVIPLQAIQRWYELFLAKLRAGGPGFLEQDG